MSFLAVLPSIYPAWTDACVASLCDDFASRVLLVDNTEHNRGVAASWNLGVDAVLAGEQDWLVILSAAMRFGAPGGQDFLATLEQASDAWAVEGWPHFGWHCLALHRRTLEAVGRFDENFFAYVEDVDYSYRFALYRGLPTSGIVEPFWHKVRVDASFAGYAHGIHLGGVRPDQVANEAYYQAKWGGPKGGERYVHPFDEADRDVRWWPEPPDARAQRRPEPARLSPVDGPYPSPAPEWVPEEGPPAWPQRPLSGPQTGAVPLPLAAQPEAASGPHRDAEEAP